ncbi:hypothetical protein Gotri_006613 [Gossypium trilobum]|uniref:Uncharacterized protein n=1 Tax=Gossypium trilobum TaxID=34281 RepID=A0A7J9F0G5_9ROSI|nr:hypothetical protein [Gossypium trilobum]
MTLPFHLTVTIGSSTQTNVGGGFLLTENGMLVEFQGLTFGETVSLYGKSFTFFGTEKLTEESEHTEYGPPSTKPSFSFCNFLLVASFLTCCFLLQEDTDFQFLQHWIKVCSFWYLVLVVYQNNLICLQVTTLYFVVVFIISCISKSIFSSIIDCSKAKTSMQSTNFKL